MTNFKIRALEMSSFNIYDFLNDPKVCQIAVPVTGGKKIRLSAVAQITTPPRLEAGFVAGQLPVNDIDTAENCLLSLDIGGPAITLVASIEEILSDRRLKLINIESIAHEQKREFFRINACVPVSLLRLPPQPQPAPITGESINISGNGILVLLPEAFGKGQRVKLRITIPEPQETEIECIGRVVRQDHKSDGFMVAFHIDTINEEDQDRLIGFCLHKQRKQLRLKVQVLGPA